jgi:hypothetical protein
MLDLGAQLRLGIFDFAFHTGNQTRLAVLFVRDGAGRNRPDHLSIVMFGTLLRTGITRIAAHIRFLVMQQLIGLRDVRNIGGGADNTVYQSRIGIDANVRFQSGKAGVLLLLPPLRTVHESLPSYGSSLPAALVRPSHLTMRSSALKVRRPCRIERVHCTAYFDMPNDRNTGCGKKPSGLTHAMHFSIGGENQVPLTHYTKVSLFYPVGTFHGMPANSPAP